MSGADGTLRKLVNVGTIGHIDHGKSSLVEALKRSLIGKEHTILTTETKMKNTTLGMRLLLALSLGHFHSGMWDLPNGLRPSKTKSTAKSFGNPCTDFTGKKNGLRERTRRIKHLEGKVVMATEIATGEGALLRFEGLNRFAQFDRTSHEQSHDWHQVDRGTFFLN